jgi:hypothetical protein
MSYFSLAALLAPAFAKPLLQIRKKSEVVRKERVESDSSNTQIWQKDEATQCDISITGERKAVHLLGADIAEASGAPVAVAAT